MGCSSRDDALSGLAPLRVWVLSAVLGAAFMQALTASGAEHSCRDLYRLTDVNHAVEPGVLVAATESLPDHCRVRGVINRAIRFEVTMPSEGWNGRLMFSAAGGMAGYLDDTVSLLPAGFAMATTDTGHSDLDLSLEFMKEPEALLDYAYRANHLTTVLAKRIITTFYGRKVDYAYLKGCSNGGRAALMEALRFPDAFNGVIAGAPVFSYKEALPWMLAQARAQRANPLTHESLAVLGNASRKACDLLDGVEDGVIDDPRKCTKEVFNVSKLECRSDQKKGCLTPGQIETAEFMYAGLLNADGKVLSPGVPPGSEGAGDWGDWIIDGRGINESANEYTRLLLVNLLHRNPQFDLDQFDPVADRNMLDDAAAFMDVWSADLTEYQAGGGRLLMYYGWNDFPLRAQRGIDHLALVEQQNGGRKATAEFFRLFLVPGMLHCRAGPGPWQVDWVDPLVRWVEEGKAPERIIGKQPGLVELSDMLGGAEPSKDAPVFTRPICRYPKYAKYSGRGDVNDEENFSCVGE